MKQSPWKLVLIVVSVVAGLIAMVPPDKKLKLGIDLSGGTILVYEVSRENRPENFNMDELIAALKQRADPQGVKETPIRKIGSNRIEIILPTASDEEVEEVKKMLTDVGSLEFRILANRKHDAAVVERALGPGGMKAPPRYKWARLGEVSTGSNPDFTSDTITDPQQKWKKSLYAGTDVVLTGKTGSGPDETVSIPVQGQHVQHAHPGASPRTQIDQLLRDRVQPQQHPRRRSHQSPPWRPDRPRGKSSAGPHRALAFFAISIARKSRANTSPEPTPPPTSGSSRRSGSSSTARGRGGSASSPASTCPRRAMPSSTSSPFCWITW